MELIEVLGEAPEAAEGGGIRSGRARFAFAGGEPAFTGGRCPTTVPRPWRCRAAVRWRTEPFVTALAADASRCRLAGLSTCGRPPGSGTCIPFTVRCFTEIGARLPATGAIEGAGLWGPELA